MILYTDCPDWDPDYTGSQQPVKCAVENFREIGQILGLLGVLACSIIGAIIWPCFACRNVGRSGREPLEPIRERGCVGSDCSSDDRVHLVTNVIHLVGGVFQGTQLYTVRSLFEFTSPFFWKY